MHFLFERSRSHGITLLASCSFLLLRTIFKNARALLTSLRCRPLCTCSSLSTEAVVHFRGSCLCIYHRILFHPFLFFCHGRNFRNIRKKHLERRLRLYFYCTHAVRPPLPRSSLLLHVYSLKQQPKLMLETEQFRNAALL